MTKKSAGRLCFVVFRFVFILAKNFKLFCSSCSVVVCRCYLFIARTKIALAMFCVKRKVLLNMRVSFPKRCRMFFAVAP